MGKYAIGVDLGGTKILAGLVDIKTGQVINKSKKKTKKDLGSCSIVDRIKETIQTVIDESSVDKKDIVGIGIGAAGQVNRSEGILISAPNLECTDIEFKKIYEKEFGIPVTLGNDVEVASIGEQVFGAGRECDNFVCVFVGTGIGSGIINNGTVYHGSTGTAGEIGHIIVQPEGRLCGCGTNGCLEAYASRTAVAKKIKSAIKKGRFSVLKSFIDEEPDIQFRSKHLKLAVDEDDELVIKCLEEAAEYLTIGLASVINFYNPQRIILGGGLVEAVDFFFEMVVKGVKTKCLPLPSNTIEISRAYLGDYSGIVGAAVMATRRKEED